MFKLQRLEITGFKSFADYTGDRFYRQRDNGRGRAERLRQVQRVGRHRLGARRAAGKSLRGGEMKDVVFAGTKSRKPGGMAEVVLHLVRDDTPL